MKATQTFAVLQRLLCQSATNPGQAGQRELLVAAPRLGKYVRERLLPPSAETLQDPQDGEGSVGRVAQVEEGPGKEQPQLFDLLPPSHPDPPFFQPDLFDHDGDPKLSK